MKYFKHKSDASSDHKMAQIINAYGMKGYGLFWYCVELMTAKPDAKKNGYRLEHDARIIAKNTSSTDREVSEMLEFFVTIGAFQKSDGNLFCWYFLKE